MQSPFRSTSLARIGLVKRPQAVVSACALLALGAALLSGAACTTSETLDPFPTGSGGNTSTGSGGASGTGSGGASGSGGRVGSGGSVVPGSGGSTGSGGASVDAGKDTGPGTIDAAPDTGGVLTYATDIAYELFFSCGGCHLAPTINGNFDLKIVKSDDVGPNAYPAITASVNSEHAGCTGLDATKKRVVPGKPANSLLYIKISAANPPSGCGGHMPNGASLAPAQIAKIKLWIEQGAKP